jgi:hypothetical protein
MLLDRDEFVITYDPAAASEEELTAAVKEVGYMAQVVSGLG